MCFLLKLHLPVSTGHLFKPTRRSVTKHEMKKRTNRFVYEVLLLWQPGTLIHSHTMLSVCLSGETISRWSLLWCLSQGSRYVLKWEVMTQEGRSRLQRVLGWGLGFSHEASNGYYPPCWVYCHLIIVWVIPRWNYDVSVHDLSHLFTHVIFCLLLV